MERAASHGTGSYPPRQHGWHRSSRNIPRPTPRSAPWRSTASMKYFEQVGSNRHRKGIQGEMVSWYNFTRWMSVHRRGAPPTFRIRRRPPRASDVRVPWPFPRSTAFPLGLLSGSISVDSFPEPVPAILPDGDSSPEEAFIGELMISSSGRGALLQPSPSCLRRGDLLFFGSNAAASRTRRETDRTLRGKPPRSPQPNRGSG